MPTTTPRAPASHQRAGKAKEKPWPSAFLRLRPAAAGRPWRWGRSHARTHARGSARQNDRRGSLCPAMPIGAGLSSWVARTEVATCRAGLRMLCGLAVAADHDVGSGRVFLSPSPRVHPAIQAVALRTSGLFGFLHCINGPVFLLRPESPTLHTSQLCSLFET
jgi:hypothetical protein